MTGQDGRSRLSTRALRMLAFLVFVMLALLVMVAQQRGAGAYVAELSASDPQEARHFVTGLMVADVLAARPPDPGAFAADYALRLPAALPLAQVTLFHVAEAGWFSLLPPTTPAALLIPALCAALLLVTAGWAAVPAAGPLPAVAVVFVLSALPPVREATLIVGPGLPLALCTLLSALAFAREVRTRRVSDAVGLAVAGSVCVLLAPAGALVLLVPPLAAVMSGRPGLLGRAGVWAPLVIWAGLAAAAAGWSGVRPGAFDTSAPAAALAEVRAAFGLLPLALAAAGALFTLGAGRPRDGVEEDVAARRAGAASMGAVTALAGAVVLALAFGMAPGMGALLLSAPVAMLAAFGAIRLIGLVTSGWTIVAGLLVALLLLTCALPALLDPVRKDAVGMEAAAEAFLARKPDPAVILVAADPGGVGALAAAIAQRDLAGQAFVVDAARLGLTVPQALVAAMDEIGASAFALGPGSQGGARAALAAFPDRFQLIGIFPRADGAGDVQLYAFLPAAPPSGAKPADPLATLRRLAAPKS